MHMYVRNAKCVCVWVCKLKYWNGKIVHWNEISMINYCHPKTICHKMNTKRHDSGRFLLFVVSHLLTPCHARARIWHHKNTHNRIRNKSAKKIRTNIILYIFMCVVCDCFRCLLWVCDVCARASQWSCCMCYVIHNVIRAIKLRSLLFRLFVLFLLHSSVFVDTRLHWVIAYKNVVQSEWDESNKKLLEWNNGNGGKVCNEIYWNLLSNELQSNVVAVIVVLLVIGVVGVFLPLLFDAIFSAILFPTRFFRFASHWMEWNCIEKRDYYVCLCVQTAFNDYVANLFKTILLCMSIVKLKAL